MLRKLKSLPNASSILPFVNLTYGAPSEYAWYDRNGECRFVKQAEGGEQGDPLMPLMFSLGIHEALVEVSRLLRDGEFLCAYLDDIYKWSTPERTRCVYDALTCRMVKTFRLYLTYNLMSMHTYVLVLNW